MKAIINRSLWTVGWIQPLYQTWLADCDEQCIAEQIYAELMGWTEGLC